MALINRWTITIGIIAIIVIGSAIVYSASPHSSSSGSGNSGKTYVCTINSEVGLANVKIVNQNTPSPPITLFPKDLPFAFNYTGGDTLQFTVTAISGYVLDTWYFSDSGKWDSRNPLILDKPARNLMMTAKFMPS